RTPPLAFSAESLLLGRDLAALDPIGAPGGAEARGSKAQIVISRADSVPGKAFEIVGRVSEKTRDPGLTETDAHLEERVSAGRELGTCIVEHRDPVQTEDR